jgi:hypothetical protein
MSSEWGSLLSFPRSCTIQRAVKGNGVGKSRAAGRRGGGVIAPRFVRKVLTPCPNPFRPNAYPDLYPDSIFGPSLSPSHRSVRLDASDPWEQVERAVSDAKCPHEMLPSGNICPHESQSPASLTQACRGAARSPLSAARRPPTSYLRVTVDTERHGTRRGTPAFNFHVLLYRRGEHETPRRSQNALTLDAHFHIWRSLYKTPCRSPPAPDALRVLMVCLPGFWWPVVTDESLTPHPQASPSARQSRPLALGCHFG